jgi:hypothetical protein
MNITYTGCVSIALGIQHAMRIRHIVFCALSGSTEFFRIISYRARFFEKKKVIDLNIRVLIFSANIAWKNSHSKKNWAKSDQKCILFFLQSTRYYCMILMKLEYSQQIFKKCSHTKYHANSSFVSRVFHCERSEGRRDEDNSRFSQFCESSCKAYMLY